MEEQKRKPGRPRKEVGNGPPPIKRPRGRPRKDSSPVPLSGEVIDERNPNSKSISHNRELKALPKIDRSDVGQVQRRIELYESICEKNGQPLTKPGLAIALGITSRALNYWIEGRYQKQNKDTIDEAMTVIEAFLSGALIQGDTRDGPGIFLMKNWFGYKDQNDIAIAPPNPQGELVPIEVLEAKFAELPDD